MRNPYDILGVAKDASEADIKKAFRRVAKTSHPDAAGDDPKAAQRFAEASQAYEILGDKDKRSKFDRGEIDGDGKPRFTGFEGAAGRSGRTGRGFDGFEFDFSSASGRPSGAGRPFTGADDGFFDLFNQAFNTQPKNPRGNAARGGGAHAAKGKDATASVSLSFHEVARGCKKRISLSNGKELDVAIPAGTQNGKTMRLRGQGFASPHQGEHGDGILTVLVEPHAVLRLEGTDLRLDLPITLDEAVLGARVRVPTLEGAVDLSLPPGVNTGRTLRLRGKGAPDGTGGSGDLYVTLKVVLPEPDAQMNDLAADIRAYRPYHVRGKEFDA